MDKTSSFQLRFGRNKESIFPHAEIVAIKNAIKTIHVNDLSNCYLYVCRMKYDGTHKHNLIDGMAKPCAGCMRAINTFGIKGVIYTTGNGYEEL
jgi:tRNA(Arg) A34 adenosine deaminase TadA